MIELEYAEVKWNLNAHCKFQCSYCDSQFKSGDLNKSVDQYLSVIEKLQDTRYQHHKKIYWKIGGGEPLHFPHLSTLLKKIKEKPSIVRLDTSGDDTWFSLYSVLNLIDSLKLTFHPWQNDDVFSFILEHCDEKKIAIEIEVPLVPGLIYESREKVKFFKDQGYDCREQILRDMGGSLHPSYSQVDKNRIHGRPDNWMPEPIVFVPNQPDPRHIDLRVVTESKHVYTGLPCYAGVDWLYINPKGFVSYSQCGGRNEHYNVFDPMWQPPAQHFACTVNQCRNEQDRKKIRILKD